MFLFHSTLSETVLLEPYCLFPLYINKDLEKGKREYSGTRSPSSQFESVETMVKKPVRVESHADGLDSPAALEGEKNKGKARGRPASLEGKKKEGKKRGVQEGKDKRKKWKR